MRRQAACCARCQSPSEFKIDIIRSTEGALVRLRTLLTYILSSLSCHSWHIAYFAYTHAQQLCRGTLQHSKSLYAQCWPLATAANKLPGTQDG